MISASSRSRPSRCPLEPIEAEILCVLAKLESLRSRHVACDPTVLAGEPVIRGTRIAARLVADRGCGRVRPGAPEARAPAATSAACAQAASRHEHDVPPAG